ncbi:MAG: O-antigen ligase family protein, partial [Candidatus Aenigmatarchaeota archaeon]
IILISIAGFEPIKNRFIVFFEGFFGRLVIFKDALKVIVDFPFLGIGLGNFRYIFTMYKEYTPFSLYYEHLHNDHLQLIIEVGLIGSFFYFYFLFRIFKNIFLNFGRRHDPFVKGISLGGLCGLIGVFLHSFVEYNFHIPATSFLFWFILGIVYKCIHTHFNYYPKDERKKI